jgi:hypothetical protein
MDLSEMSVPLYERIRQALTNGAHISKEKDT